METQKGFEEEDYSEWVPLSPPSEMKAKPASPSNLTVPEADDDDADDDKNVDDDAALQQRTLEFDSLTISTPTSNGGSTNDGTDNNEPSRWVTPTTTEKCVTPTPTNHLNGHSKVEVSATTNEPAPLQPSVHRYRGSLNIDSKLKRRKSNNSTYSSSSSNNVNNESNLQSCPSISSGYSSFTFTNKKRRPTSAENLLDKSASPDAKARRYVVASLPIKSASSSPSDEKFMGNEGNHVTVVANDSCDNTTTDGDGDDFNDDDNDHEYDGLDEIVFVGDVSEIPPPPPVDTKLKDMTVIVSKRLVGVSLKDYYDTCWSQGGGPSFFETWLISRGKTQTSVQDWESASIGDEFVGRWCGEKYSQQRVVTFQYQRTSDLHCGCLDAEVQQVQMFRMEGKDRMVVSMQIDTRGIPFADNFLIEVRWVVTRVQSNDLSVEVGVVVEFLKPTVLAGKLRAELINETTKEQVDLFKNMKRACAKLVENKSRAIIPRNTNGINLPIMLLSFLKVRDSVKRLPPRSNNDWHRRINEADQKLRQISTLLEIRSSSTGQDLILSDTLDRLETVNQILDQVATKLQSP